MSEEILPRPTRDQEIASTRDGLDITRGYTGPLLVPADRVLRQRGGGDLAVYESVLSEPQVQSTLQQRRLAITSKEWTVEPASSRRADKKAAEFISKQLRKIGFDGRTGKMHYGLFYGYAVAELLYGVEDGLIVWTAIKVRNRRRFRFTPGGDLRMLTMSNMFEGVELPKEKFWTFSTGADNDDEPYGLGLAHWCYWPAFFKRNDIKFWLKFVEKFAGPTSVGEYDPSASETEKANLLGALRALQTDSGIIIPKGMAINLIEAARSGTADYKSLHDTMDDTIAKVVLGQTASSQGAPGKLGEDKLQGDVRDELVKADADLLCESLNDGPIKWLTQWNFPDAEPPRVSRVLEDPEDLTARATRDKSIFDMGFRPSLAYVQQTYGGEWLEKAPEPPPVPGVPGAPPAPAADFAAGDVVRDPPRQMAPLLDRDIAPAGAAWVEKVRNLVEFAESWDDVRDGLTALIPDMTLDDYAGAMAQATAAARLAGRYEVREEHGG